MTNANAKPIPFRKGKRQAGTIVRPLARLLRAEAVVVDGETVVTPLPIRTERSRAGRAYRGEGLIRQYRAASNQCPAPTRRSPGRLAQQRARRRPPAG